MQLQIQLGNLGDCQRVQRQLELGLVDMITNLVCCHPSIIWMINNKLKLMINTSKSQLSGYEYRIRMNAMIMYRCRMCL